MNLLLDACLSPEWQPALERAGFVCQHWFAIGALNATDAEILKWAGDHDHVILRPIWTTANFFSKPKPDHQAL